MNVDINKNPWLGLKSYREGEILYGRDEDIRSLSQQILNDTDTVLYGRSGIGKSSIINAGVIPSARRHNIKPIYIRLDHQDSEKSYIEQIYSAIFDENIQIKNIVPLSSPNQYLLWELFHCNEFYNEEAERIKLLIIFDQFEEIFTLQQNSAKKRDFFNELADYLNDIIPSLLSKIEHGDEKPQELVVVGGDIEINLEDLEFNDNKYVDDNEIHLVFTLREDFLSEFEYYTSAIPSLKQHRYGLRPINEEQASEIILKPRHGLISKDVAHLIIEKVTGRKDFLLDGVPEIEVDSAVLSLYLNRLYEEKTSEIISAELVEEKGSEIIKSFYDDSCKGIPEKVIETIEDELLNDERRRESKSYNTICRLGKDYVDLLIDRQLLRKFSYSGEQKVEFIHDILCDVIYNRKEERKKQEELRLQEVAAQRKLAEEEKKRKEIEEKAIADKKRNRKIRFITTSIIVLLLGIGITYWFLAKYEVDKYYLSFEKINGWPNGVGKELTDEQREKVPLYYKLSKEGYLAPNYTDVKVMSSNPKLPISLRLNINEVCESDIDGLDKNAKHFYELNTKVAHIHFIPKEQENKKRGTFDIDKEVFFAEDGKILYMINYFHSENGSDVWAHYVDATGKSLALRDNNADRMKYSTDSLGRVVSAMYYDNLNVCRPVANNICGYSIKYLNKNRCLKYLLDEFGCVMNSTYNIVSNEIKEDTIKIKYGKATSVNDTIPAQVIGPEGYCEIHSIKDVSYLYLPGKKSHVAEKHITRDDRGNILEEKISGQVTHQVPAIIRKEYSDVGFLTTIERLNVDKTPYITLNDSIYKKEWKYSENGELLAEKHYKGVNDLIYEYQKTIKNNVTTILVDDKINKHYYEQIDSTINNKLITTFYGKSKQPIVWQLPQDTLIRFHKRIIDTLENNITKTYYYILENNVIVPISNSERGANGMYKTYYCREQQLDEKGNIKYYRLYDNKNNILTSMMYFYDNGYARAVMGVDGTPVRCPDWEEEGLAYYKLYYNKDENNNFANLKVIDEFGNIGSLYDPMGESYLKVDYIKLMDEQITLSNKLQITIATQIVQPYFNTSSEGISDFSLPYLHIIDKNSQLYKNGLRDGDRIMKLGQWSVGNSLNLLEQEWNRMRNNMVEVEVYRQSDNSFEQIIKSVGRSNAELEHYHILNLTIEELNHFNKNKK